MANISTLLKAVFPCLPINTERGIQLPTDTASDEFMSEKFSVQFSSPGGKKSKLSSEEAASSILSALEDADKAGPSLDATIQSIVHQAGSWYESMMEKILTGLEAIVKAGKPMKGAMHDAYDKACKALEETEGFAADHPVLCTIVALGILVVLAPYVVEYLGFCAGFGELGPIEGKSRFLWCIATIEVY